MEKRRVRLEINGVVCGLITEESDAYMQDLAAVTGERMNEIMMASPFITKESAAVTTALIYLDTARKAENRELEKKRKLAEIEKRNLELERQAAQLRKENNRLTDKAAALHQQLEGSFDKEDRRRLEDRIADLEMRLAMQQNMQAQQEEKSEAQENPEEGFVEFTAVPLPPIDKKVKLRNPLRNSEWEENNFTTFFEKKDGKSRS